MIINTVFTGSSIRALSVCWLPPFPRRECAALVTSARTVMILLARLTASTKVSLAKSRSGADQRVLKARQFLLQPQSPK